MPNFKWEINSWLDENYEDIVREISHYNIDITKLKDEIKERVCIELTNLYGVDRETAEIELEFYIKDNLG